MRLKCSKFTSNHVLTNVKFELYLKYLIDFSFKLKLEIKKKINNKAYNNR